MESAAGTRERIRAEAIALFTIHGYEKTSLREIADRVGITKASLYYHYPSKQSLLLAVVDPLVRDWTELVDDAATLPHSPDTVRAVLERSLDMMLRHRAAAALIVRDASAMLGALAPVWTDLIELGNRLHTWLAGPHPTDAGRVRAVAAMEVLGVALGSGATLPDVPERLLRPTLLDAAQAVLRG